MRKSLISLAVAAACGGLVMSTAAGAHEGGMANEGYVGDSSGQLVLDGSGDCVRTSSWTKELALAECDPDLVPKPEPVVEAAPAPAPAPQAVTESVSLSAGALFDVNKDTLKPAGQDELRTLAARIKTINVEHIDIAGHTDSTGAEAYNQDLSVRRANAVKNFLIDQGIDPRIMSTIGYGESRPIADNRTSAGRAQNRRVEVTLRGTRPAN